MTQLSTHPNAGIEGMFRESMISAGLRPPLTIIPDGRRHRFSTNGAAGDDAGYYVLYPDGIPAGHFGDYRSGVHHNWCSRTANSLTPVERATHQQRMAQIKEQRDTEERAYHEEAAQAAHNIWEAASEAPIEHPYLVTKGILPCGAKIYCGSLTIAEHSMNGALLIPLRDVSDALSSLEFILEDGSKYFLPRGRKHSCFYRMGDIAETTETICVVEGFATGASVHEAINLPVVVAFDAGNLRSVAEVIRAKHPHVQLIICGDHDMNNTGQTKAREAANSVNGSVVIPTTPGLDWNDLHQREGLKAVREAVQDALRQPSTLSSIPDHEEDPVEEQVTRLPMFPEEAWRGPFALYRQAMEGTSEAPDTAHFAALWAVAATCLRRRVSFYYAYPHYPNVYLVNFGGTGDSKTSAGRQALGLLPPEGVKILRGVGSAEALGDWMQQPEAGLLLSHLLFVEELATVLTRGGWEGSTLLSFLTETFDAPGRYEIPFRKNPVLVHEPTPNLFAGTTVEWLWKGLREIDIHGGFGNRIFFLTGTPKPPIPLPTKPNAQLMATIRSHIARLSCQKPMELVFTPEATALWSEFYMVWKSTTWPELTTAAIKRIPAYILKLSMVYACLEQTSLITAEQLSAAIQVGHYGARCTDLLMGRHRQQGVQGKCEARVLSVLANKELPPWQIHRSISGSFSADELNRAIRALEATGAIRVIRKTSRGEPVYGIRGNRRSEV